jgi:hypothetical protein
MKLAIAPYVMPFVYGVVALVLVVGLVLISIRVLFHEGADRLWR